MESRDAVEEDFWVGVPGRARRSGAGPPGTVGTGPPLVRTVASLMLAGLTTVEVIALVLVAVGLGGLLWATGALLPERLVTDPWVRVAWIGLILALVRPVTWIPYVVPFVGLRRLTARWAGRQGWIRFGVLHLLTVALLAGAVWVVGAAVEDAGRVAMSWLAFASGSGTVDTLGSFRGHWPLARIAGIVLAVLIGRIALPPLGSDLDLSPQPVLGLVSGGRGRFDRVLVLVCATASLAMGAVALFLGARG